MKIVVLTTGHRPDDDRIYFKEILSLLTKYPQVHLVAPVKAGETYALGSGVVLHPLVRRRGVWGRLRTLVAAAAEAIRLKPDVCHFHDLDFVVLAPWVRWRSGARMVYDAHEVYPESMLISPNIPVFLRPLAAWIVDRVEKTCAKSCALIVTADPPNTESFARTGVPAITLFNYPRLSLFVPDPLRVEVLRRDFAGRRVLIYQGTMSRDRGLFHMLEGIRRLKDDVPAVLLLLVGLNDARLRAEADDDIRRYGLGDHVRILPWVPHADMANHMALAEIGLVPWQPSEKNKKNIPIKVFEYMACGIPLLVADLPSITHYIAESGAGVVYDSTDASVFFLAARRMLENAPDRKAMAKAGLEAVARWWNWGEMEKALIAGYESLAARRFGETSLNDGEVPNHDKRYADR